MRLGHGWWLWIAIVAASLRLTPATPAEAQAEAGFTQEQAQGLRVAVLRATEGDAGTIAGEVDGALLRDLAGLAGIENPTVSPIDYAEIQLTVGCSDEGRQCLSSIAQTVQVDAVVVRHLSVQAGKVTLTLTHFDATASDEPSRAEQVSEGADAGKSAVAAVPGLVRKLFGIPDSVVTASAAASTSAPEAATAGSSGPAVDQDQRIHVLTWVTLAAGSGLLAGGLVVGATAQSSFDAYKKTDVKNSMDIMRANTKFDSVKSKALLANVLIPSGAAIMALAGVLLVLDLTRDDHKSPSLGLQPLRGGALLTLRGVAGGL